MCVILALFSVPFKSYRMISEEYPIYCRLRKTMTLAPLRSRSPSHGRRLKDRGAPSTASSSPGARSSQHWRQSKVPMPVCSKRSSNVHNGQNINSLSYRNAVRGASHAEWLTTCRAEPRPLPHPPSGGPAMGARTRCRTPVRRHASYTHPCHGVVPSMKRPRGGSAHLWRSVCMYKRPCSLVRSTSACPERDDTCEAPPCGSTNNFGCNDDGLESVIA